MVLIGWAAIKLPAGTFGTFFAIIKRKHKAQR